MITETRLVTKSTKVEETFNIVEFSDFLKFLLTNCFVHSYFNHFNNDYHKFFNNVPPTKWISDAFTWPDGANKDFYQVIHERWNKYLKNNNVIEGRY